MRDRLIELIRKAKSNMWGKTATCELERNMLFADYLLANGVILPPCEVGEEIWVIDREDGEAVDVSAVRFLAKSKNCIIATAWINDYDIDETLEYHINETQDNFDTDLKVYPAEDCFATREEAEQALRDGE